MGPLALTGSTAHAASGTESAAALSASGQLKVLTLNAGGADGDGALDVLWNRRAAHLADWIARNNPVPDVIALQELWGWLEVKRS
jgi:hypothetical protein